MFLVASAVEEGFASVTPVWSNIKYRRKGVADPRAQSRTRHENHFILPIAMCVLFVRFVTQLACSPPPISPPLRHPFTPPGGYPPQEQEQPVPGASSALGQTLVGAMAEAIGARRGASLELLGHFLRAGGGDVAKAASLYATMADEFVELREMARCGDKPDN